MASIIFMIIVPIVIVVSLTAIVQAVWNKTLIKKFPTSNIQPLNFTESFVIIVFTGILFRGSTFITQQVLQQVSPQVSPQQIFD